MYHFDVSKLECFFKLRKENNLTHITAIFFVVTTLQHLRIGLGYIKAIFKLSLLIIMFYSVLASISILLGIIIRQFLLNRK